MQENRDELQVPNTDTVPSGKAVSSNLYGSKVALLASGTFNPPTYMHLRMFGLSSNYHTIHYKTTTITTITISTNDDNNDNDNNNNDNVVNKNI